MELAYEITIIALQILLIFLLVGIAIGIIMSIIREKKKSSRFEPHVMLNFADRVRLTDEQLKDVNTMVENWTDEKSKDRAIEELLELSLSLLHLARNKTDLESLHKEMADVRLALEHLEFKFGNYQKELNEKLEQHSKISV